WSVGSALRRRARRVLLARGCSLRLDPARFFFNETAPTEIYPLSLHEALPICFQSVLGPSCGEAKPRGPRRGSLRATEPRSEEHTSELQSLTNLVCRLLLE